MNVPFVDLKLQYRAIKSEIDAALKDVLESATFVGGDPVKTFEELFAKAHGVKHVIGVANGTDAIYIVLKMLGIGQGDEVITTASSWISTSEAISLAGATPVFVDIDARTYTINTDLIESKITSKTKAILPVHLYGQMASIASIKNICQQHQLFLVEDCAQSHFSQENGVLAGLSGDAGTFSFYPGKNLGAYGDAGCIMTNDDQLAARCRMYANHGSLKKHDHQMEGINSRLDTLQASVLNVKLKYINSWTLSRIANAARYSELLSKIPEVTVPYVRQNTVHTFHLYVIQVKNRNDLMEYLAKQNIQTAVHYPKALPNLPVYKYLKTSEKDFPVATQHQNQILSLPIYPELSSSQIEYVCSHIQKFFIKK